VVLVYFCAIAAWHGQWWRDPLGSEARRFVLHALMLQNWGLTTPNEFNWPAWSVSAEWLVYLLFPLFVLAWARTPRRAALLVIPLLLAGMAALFAAAGYSTITLNEGMGLLRALIEFAVGFLLWRLYRAGEVQRWNWSAIGALSLGLVIALVVLSAGQSWTDFPLVALFVPLMLSLAYGRGPLARICSTRAIVFLGEASYSIYLVHFAVLRRVLDIMTRHASDWPPVALASLFIASVVLGSLAAGVALHLLIERPCRRLVRQSLGIDGQPERRAAPVNAPG
jgi:peptidoglycan/LPS O-acetylase OafA/YrhL